MGRRSKAARNLTRDKIGVCLRANRKDMLTSPAPRQPWGKRKITWGGGRGGEASRLDGCSGKKKWANHIRANIVISCETSEPAYYDR